MKTILFSILALMLVFVAVPEASGQLTATVVNESYANNARDTVTTPSNLALFAQIDAYISAADSFNCEIYVETKPKNGSTWTVKDSVSINSVNGANQIWVLRQEETNLIPGVQIDVRLRPVFAASVNNLTGKSYSITLGYTR